MHVGIKARDVVQFVQLKQLGHPRSLFNPQRKATPSVRLLQVAKRMLWYA